MTSQEKDWAIYGRDEEPWLFAAVTYGDPGPDMPELPPVSAEVAAQYERWAVKLGKRAPK